MHGGKNLLGPVLHGMTKMFKILILSLAAYKKVYTDAYTNIWWLFRWNKNREFNKSYCFRFSMIFHFGILLVNVQSIQLHTMWYDARSLFTFTEWWYLGERIFFSSSREIFLFFQSFLIVVLNRNASLRSLCFLGAKGKLHKNCCLVPDDCRAQPIKLVPKFDLDDD